MTKPASTPAAKTHALQLHAARTLNVALNSTAPYAYAETDSPETPNTLASRLGAGPTLTVRRYTLASIENASILARTLLAESTLYVGWTATTRLDAIALKASEETH